MAGVDTDIGLVISEGTTEIVDNIFTGNHDSGDTPLLNYTEPDVVINEVDDGQPCLACGERCTGFTQHKWRNTCNVCKCPRELHDIYNENFVNIRDRLGWKRDNDPTAQVSKDRTLREGYTWIPPGLSSEQIEEYMEQLPNHKIPLLGHPGERYRDIQIIRQLPKQDLSMEYCKMLSSSIEKKEYNIFRELRDNIAMDIGIVQEAVSLSTCDQCKGEIEPTDLAVFAPKLGAELCWHPACFVCSKCEELLVDLVYCCHTKKLFCERHYAEQIRPRCPSCDELIFSGEYTKAMDENYHKDHLACHNCDKKLVACRYIVKDENPHCIPCYQELYAHNCEECKKPIGPDYKDLSYKDRHWHEFCFKCCECQKSLVDQPFAPKNDNIYCSDCHDKNFAARCDGCGEPFKGGMKKFEYKGKQWHEECFVCMVCKQPIRNMSFIPRDNEAVCVPCYEEQFAQKCSKCNGVINKGGVSYKNSPWHRECFTCTQCNKELAKEKFTSKDDKPYCADCYGELFAKKCCRCSKAITGFGGTKFISFEDRHWHSDCFVCYKCNTSMVGKGFLMNEGDILCPECGRN
ncbi:prickle planar cell polarity protein 3-A-like isoform X2 [Saccostrea echinata]|uniref:prickle planar cell polarity protein 3-A-like isoform X2 n=1 Tax=Saccostrea echinata TaxID=191078 RepID=UPI002A8104B4|nr:prickle planar cell polarity protein 3-A-like isoform X2 [Saccostrea echinata]